MPNSGFRLRIPPASSFLYYTHIGCFTQSLLNTREFTLIIGADNWLISRWYKAEEILKNHHVMIYPRPNFTIDPTTLPPSVQLADTPLLEVSSTFIRQALAEGRDIRYFLHPAVYERLKK